MTKSIKTLVAVLALAVSFTSCTKDETPAPTPIVEVDIRDAAEGIFQAEFDNESVQFEFTKNDSIQDQMMIEEYEDGSAQGGGVTVLNIVETENGFDYELDEDDIIGTYDKTTDIHTLKIVAEGMEWTFNRVK